MDIKDTGLSGSEPKRLLVIGNGFDLDLGYKTGYKDFVANDNPVGEGRFPFVEKGKDSHTLGKFILKCKDINSWFDLERALAEFGRIDPAKEYKRLLNEVTSKGDVFFTVGNIVDKLLRRLNKGKGTKDRIRGDQEDYNRLIQSIQAYLSSVDLDLPREDSTAARLLKAFCASCAEPQIFSFNYTDLVRIGNALGVAVGNPVYVHGALKDGSAVLGVGDYVEMRDSANYLYKTSSDNYRSSKLLESLDTFDEVYIFGLSLSQVDYPYFEDFLSRIASGKYGHARKYIRIFTLDDASRLDILRNLRSMNKSMIKLMDYADIDIIRTADSADESKLLQVLARLHGTS
jgi:hypothetical protein